MFHPLMALTKAYRNKTWLKKKFTRFSLILSEKECQSVKSGKKTLSNYNEFERKNFFFFKIKIIFNRACKNLERISRRILLNLFFPIIVIGNDFSDNLLRWNRKYNQTSWGGSCFQFCCIERKEIARQAIKLIKQFKNSPLRSKNNTTILEGEK